MRRKRHTFCRSGVLSARIPRNFIIPVSGRNSTIGILHGQKSSDGVQLSQQSNEIHPMTALPIVAGRLINTCLHEIPFLQEWIIFRHW
jgi:hypothetical protein